MKPVAQACCSKCEHEVSQVTARGMMPDTEDGREVRLLIARDVGPCENCGKDD